MRSANSPGERQIRAPDGTLTFGAAKVVRGRLLGQQEVSVAGRRGEEVHIAKVVEARVSYVG